MKGFLSGFEPQNLVFVMPGQKRVFALDVPGIHILLTLRR